MRPANFAAFALVLGVRVRLRSMRADVCEGNCAFGSLVGRTRWLAATNRTNERTRAFVDEHARRASQALARSTHTDGRTCQPFTRHWRLQFSGATLAMARVLSFAFVSLVLQRVATTKYEACCTRCFSIEHNALVWALFGAVRARSNCRRERSNERTKGRLKPMSSLNFCTLEQEQEEARPVKVKEFIGRARNRSR